MHTTTALDMRALDIHLLKPRLPTDVAFGLENSKENKKNYIEYILDLKYEKRSTL